MAILTYNLHVSLDGYIEDPDGSLDYSMPDEESHRFSNRQTVETSVFLFGRRLYEAMEDYWTDPERAAGDPVEAEFAELYKATPGWSSRTPSLPCPTVAGWSVVPTPSRKWSE